MTCLDARKRIFSYLNQNLDEKELRDFLDHLEGCPDCMEELRITHMVYAGVASLDDEKGDDTANLNKDFEKKIEQSQFVLIRSLLFKISCYVLETLAFWAFVTTLLLQIRFWIT